MPSSDPLRRFQDIVDNVERIERYARGLDLPGLLAHGMALDAVERCLARISETAAKLGDEAERRCPGLPWHGIRRIGNYLRHEYEAIDKERLWTIIVSDLKPLKIACIEAISAIRNEVGG